MDIANVSINADLHKQWALCHHVVFDDFQTLRQKLKSSCTAEQFGSLHTEWIPSFIVELDQYIRNLELANDLRLAERAPRIPCKPETLARLKYALGTVKSVDDLQVNGPQISRDFEFEFSLIHQWYIGLCGGGDEVATPLGSPQETGFDVTKKMLQQHTGKKSLTNINQAFASRKFNFTKRGKTYWYSYTEVLPVLQSHGRTRRENWPPTIHGLEKQKETAKKQEKI